MIMSVVEDFEEIGVEAMGQVKIGKDINQKTRRSVVTLLKKYAENFKDKLDDEDGQHLTQHEIHIKE